MNTLLKQINALSSAEDFFDFFKVDYVQSIVNINRLHILKRFHQYLRATPDCETMEDDTLKATCQLLLVRAYNDFVTSTPAREKVFKVFQDQDGKRIGLENLKNALPSKQGM